MKTSNPPKFLLILAFTAAIVTFLAINSHARRYDFSNTNISIGFMGGYTWMRDGDYVQKALPAGSSLTQDPLEMGMIFGLELGIPLARWQLAFGADYIYPGGKKILGSGTDNLTTPFVLSTKSTSLIPRVSLEFYPLYFIKFRVFFGISYGLAYHTVENNYTFTSAAHALGYHDFKEIGKATSAYYEGHGGMEFFFVDNWSIGIKLGYKRTNVEEYTHQNEIWNFGNSVTSGRPWTNRDGTNREIDLSGIYGCATLRLLY